MRSVPFTPDQLYHVYNRGVDKRRIFLDTNHYLRFIQTIKNILLYNTATKRSKLNQSLALKSVTLLAYCLMPNHYHLLLREEKEQGISQFMHKLDTSYTKYFNTNTKRSGRLFEYTFKAKHIDSENLLIHVYRYIHLNPLIAGIVGTLDDYPWSSYPDVTGKRNGTLCATGELLAYFQNKPEKYITFVNDQVAYAQLLKRIKDEGDEDKPYLS